ncbi:hypothetical protein AKJ09_10419 [Labilithrix luteola]|uniref:Uncharacterized protein n=1 Tax=Labilithrix luteola TaxID=1391654 RepID=A0A0K1QDB1_9BACT|nr:hypothetical protein [Labilithrix luteola]AKV03756.1 hypothetical protein AKJ09_10419 [Labilithrix luteola]
MKLSLTRTPLLLLLAACAASATACTADASDDGAAVGDEEDLTSLTARARRLDFAGYVYVAEGTSDYAIVSEVKRQTQSAFGALREGNVGVNSRELKDVNPATFLKTPVTVVDPANPGATTKMVKVAYTFTDNAVVPVPMATRSAISLGLLGRNYQSQSDRILRECTTGDAHAREFQSSIWYVFDPALSSCKTAMATEQQKIDADRHGLAEGQVPLSEVNRLYIPMTANLKTTSASTATKYPEYDRLYAGGVEPGKLVIGMVSGMMADWAAGERHEVYEDQGYEMWYGGLREIFKARPNFKLASVEGVANPLSYSVGGTSVTFASFDDMVAFELDNKNPAGVTYANRNELRKQIATTLVKRWITFEVPVQVKIGATTKPLTIKLQSYFGAETDATPHKRGIKTSDIFVYNGHSYIGYGPLDPSRFTTADFPASYQVLMINGCVSYNYYEKDYIPLKAGGTKNLDLVTNGLESWVNESGEAMGRFVGSFIDGKINSYNQILKNSQFTYFGYDWGMDALRVVDGELDNKYKPTKTPISLQ